MFLSLKSAFVQFLEYWKRSIRSLRFLFKKQSRADRKSTALCDKLSWKEFVFRMYKICAFFFLFPYLPKRAHEALFSLYTTFNQARVFSPIFWEGRQYPFLIFLKLYFVCFKSVFNSIVFNSNSSAENEIKNKILLLCLILCCLYVLLYIYLSNTA